jgi:cytochrome c556
MKMKTVTVLSLILLICMMAATIYAQGVLSSTGQKSPGQAVAARKFAMRTLGANFGDVRGKIKAGNIKGIAANASSIAALATFLPLVFGERYPGVYPVKGSKYFFKGAPRKNIEGGFRNLRTRAAGLMKSASAGDKSGVEAQFGKLGGACNGCHKAFRGEY